MEKKLHRDEHRKVIAGVCAGLAEYLNVDVTIVRLVFVAAFILKGSGFLIYVILWIVLPRKDYTFIDPTVDYTIPPVGSSPATPFMNMPPMPPPPRGRSGGALIGGLLLITIGTLFLLDQFNIFPNLDFENLWPVVLVVVGIGIIFSGSKEKNEPWKKFGSKTWPETDQPTPNDNPPAQQL